MKINFNKLNLKVLIFSAIFILVVLSGVAYVMAIGVWYEGYRVNNGAVAQNIIIDAAGTCKKITNNSGNAIFIPTKTAAEWNNFAANKPAGVTIDESQLPNGCYCTVNSQCLSGYCIP